MITTIQHHSNMEIPFGYYIDKVNVNVYKLTLRDGSIDCFKTLEDSVKAAWSHSLK